MVKKSRRGRITHKDVAEKAGVSVATVSYVVNDGPRPVSAETRARVEQAIDELGYIPNELARSLRLQTSSTIGLIVPNITHLVNSEIARGVKEICNDRQYVLLLGDSSGDPVQEQNLAQMFRSKQVDGMIIWPNHGPMNLIEFFEQSHIPTVLLQHNLPGTYCVAVDDLRGGFLATEHLLKLGHRRVGIFRAPPFTLTSAERLFGYQQALDAAAIKYDPALVVEIDSGYQTGQRAMEYLLSLPDPPAAVFTHDDVMAVGAMYAIRQAGLSVPEDISVVGYDNVRSSAFLFPPLTTVHYSNFEMGRKAAQIVLSLIGQEESLIAQTIRMPVELVVRASTAPPRRS